MPTIPYEPITLVLVVIGTIIALGTWIATSSERSARKLEDKRVKDLADNPFERLQCWIKTVEGGPPGGGWLGEIAPAEVDGRLPDYKAGEVLVLSRDQYFIYIQIFARTGVTIHKINLRFLGNEPRPQIMNLKTPTLPQDNQRNPMDTQGGRDLYHDMTISEGRAINYAARIGIEEDYTGELSLRLEVSNTGRSYVLRIPCTTQEPPSQTATRAAPARPWWKLW